MKPILSLLLLIISTQSWGYANFIGHGYTSCLNCHYNPFGGGQLNDYGRAVSATAISSRIFLPDSVSEDQLAYSSGFLFRKPKQEVVRLQANYRGFSMYSNPNSKVESKRWMTMQSDVRATVQLGKKKEWIISGEYGRAPISDFPLQEGMKEKDHYSRSYFAGYRPSPNIGVYVGLMDKVYGLRLVEHIAFSRQNPKVSQNDTTHGVSTHLIKNEWELGLHGFFGHLDQEASYRLKGASFMLERTVGGIHRIGMSALSQKNDFQRINSVALHGKLNLKEGSALLAEVGQTSKKFEEGANSAETRYGLLQTYLRPWRGVYFFTNVEYQKQNIHKDDYMIRFGPGVQIFPMQRMELRADLYNTRNFSKENTRKDNWLLLLQTHFWL